MGLVRSGFIKLSENKALNNATKQIGLKYGAEKVVGGVTVDETIEKFKSLNEKGLSVTFDNLGEFVTDTMDAQYEKDLILEMIKSIHENGVNAHGSIKLTQIGLNIDYDFCKKNFTEIVDAAHQVGMFINVDMESYAVYHDTIRMVDELREEYDNVGTVLQAYLYEAQNDVVKYKDSRVRLVKGAYKENETVALQDKDAIDAAFFELIKKHLVDGTGFTSIATHDDAIIDKTIEFVKENNIDNDSFEFQMLYGFRSEYLLSLSEKGYNTTVYVPYGNDWYAYFMRRLAERPQNLNLIAQGLINNKTFQASAAIITCLGVIAGTFALFKRK